MSVSDSSGLGCTKELESIHSMPVFENFGDFFEGLRKSIAPFVARLCG